MTTLVEVGLSNVIASAALAVVAIAVGLVCRRPAVVHALWLLVLLKLVTPPLFRVHLPWPGEKRENETVGAPVETPPAPGDGAGAELLGEDQPGPEAEEPQAAPEAALAGAAPSDEPPSLPAAAPPPAAETASGWQSLLGVVWLGGSAAWFALAARRAWRFTRALRHSRPASPAVRARVEALAAQLGLARAPDVRLLPGRLPPMVWAVGRPVLLLPADLPAQVGAEGLDTLLVHELAHLRRRDHWVRWLEMLILGLFWWDPLAWYARQQLREAEEQCCDAWVVGTMPQARRAYASALVDALDFLSTADAPPPVLASGVGQVVDLKRRLTMILRGTPSPRLGLLSGLAVLTLTGLMPLMPGWASSAQEGEKKVIIVGGESESGELLAVQIGDDGVQRLEAELRKKKVEIEALAKKIVEAKTKKFTPLAGKLGGSAMTIRIEISGVGAAEAKAIAEAIQKALPGGKDKKVILSIDGKSGVKKSGTSEGGVKKPGASGDGKTLRVVDEKSRRVLVIDVTTGKILREEAPKAGVMAPKGPGGMGGMMGGLSKGPGGMGGPGGPGGMMGGGGMKGPGDRMDRIEKQLDLLLKELAELKRQSAPRPGMGGGRGPGGPGPDRVAPGRGGPGGTGGGGEGGRRGGPGGGGGEGGGGGGGRGGPGGPGTGAK